MARGRKKLIESEEQLYQYFKEYKTLVKGNPYKIHDFLGGKELYEVYRQKEKPLTLSGFYNFCAENYSDVHNYFDNTYEGYNDFKGITTRIREEIREDQISGAMVGMFNPNLTARLNGLKEQTDVTSNNKEIKLPPYMQPKNGGES